MHLNNDWDALWQEEQDKPYMQQIHAFLNEAYQTKHIYPARDHIFNALQTTSLADTKVVILGQDPYHGQGQAQGFAFSVPADFPLPPSLQNIYKELEMEYHISLHRNGDLTDWARQGVLLLNTILTVEEGKPLSHANLGWQTFTDRVLAQINKKEDPVVFLLWGAKAKAAMKLLDNPNHLILTCPHPSPLSAHRGFFGCNHFKSTNLFLTRHGKAPINWVEPN
ncbi:MAG: uracil-DNA glycosylase [Catenisphaera adipataccumulans]|jgi:uracil-DNA glycosylase|uniref:uracil-DNA glycosylase n=1 Tax=Catenisphaera adipataccumulans TaxID=700500 RepID=UPI003D8CA009